ncbi:SFT2 domain protein [Aspergillus steynii IBT 23096]|uniref:Protein transport protein SFT2 n=1 Tax=Aspergillus steynii IBT 23096 TaxID=1392250 RepID=A0A2I2FTJ3_9EURO|nr:SFT2 domain protein [Aspergillus steynii IBT 23096]PLB43968.1 SFT2 domain protein [Aspergillus steynii IBT 23096]
MTSNSFRDSVNSLGWSRRDPDLPVRTNNSAASTPFLSRLQSWNPFGGEGYVQLPTHEAPGAPLPAANRREEEDTFFALSRWDRMLVFVACNLGAAVCFLICFFLFPVLSLKPRKFAILWSVGSLLFLLSWAVLMGPLVYAKHLVSGSRLPFTAAYFGSIAMTLYFAIGLHSTFLTLISSIFQLAALLWYLVSYFPMGSTGLQFMGRFGAQRVTSWITN